MNDDRQPAASRDKDAERALSQLFARAKPREAPPAADTEEVRRAVYAEWDAVTGRRVRLRRFGALAAACALAAVATWSLLDLGAGPALPTVAFIERVQGPVDGAPQIGAALRQGAVVTTGNGQLALRLATGGSLRLAPQTRVELSPHGAELMAGALYFDSEDARASAEPFTVVTALGTLRDVGTQFIARLAEDQFEVGVRDGRVALASGVDSGDAAAGEKLVVVEGTNGIRRDSMATFGAEWAWADRLAPPFDIDGRRLIDFLTWVAAQTGRTLVFVAPAAEQVARDAELSGSIDLEPMAKLTAVLALTDLGFALDGERLLINTK
jgi:ferric-dicitrate binding protein FerR (iron transport regulator)